MIRPTAKLQVCLLISVALGCSDVAGPELESARLTEGVTLSQPSVEAGAVHRLALDLAADTVVQVRVWSVGLLYGIEATLKDAAGNVICPDRRDGCTLTASSAGAELQIPGVRVEEAGRYELSIRWIEGEGLANYRYEQLAVEPPQVVRSWERMMNDARAGHTATRLEDGRILIVGGHPSGSGMRPGAVVPVVTAELISPDDGSVERVGDLAEPRAYHAASLIGGDSAQYAGKVLIAGGLGDRGEALLTTEIYDPVNRSFTPGPLLPAPRAFLQALAVSGTGSFLDGKVVLAGGERTRRGPQHDRASKTYQEIDENPEDLWYFDPGSGQIVRWGELSQGRFQMTMTLLSDGRLMFIGGGIDSLPSLPGCEQTDQNICHCSGAGVHLCTEFTDCNEDGCAVRNFTRKDRGTRRVEIYDTQVGTMSVLGARLNRGRLGHSAVLLPGDRVLIAGGATAARRSFHPTETNLPEYPKTLDSVEIYVPEADDPTTGEFRPLQSLAIPREQHVAVTLEGGRVALIGGVRPVPGSTEAVSLIEIYQPGLQRFVATDVLSVPYGAPAVALTSDGTGIIVTGGEDSGEPQPQTERIDL